MIDSLDNVKEFYRATQKLTSAELIQSGLPRIVLHEVDTIEVDSIDKPTTRSYYDQDNAFLDTAPSVQMKFVTFGVIKSTVARRDVPTFLESARRLDQRGQTDESLDLIYDQIDDLMKKQKFAELDSILTSLPAKLFSADVLLGIITATLPARRQLSSRPKFIEAAKNELFLRGQPDLDLFIGLE